MHNYYIPLSFCDFTINDLFHAFHHTAPIFQKAQGHDHLLHNQGHSTLRGGLHPGHKQSLSLDLSSKDCLGMFSEQEFSQGIFVLLLYHYFVDWKIISFKTIILMIDKKNTFSYNLVDFAQFLLGTNFVHSAFDNCPV